MPTATPPVVELRQWFQTAPGDYLRAWEQARYDEAVADVFGFHALQLGGPALDTLTNSRMPHRWLAMDVADVQTDRAQHLRLDYAALPFEAGSIDLVTLPHTLEQHADPHTTLREVERVLVPEGRVIICGLNPASLWSLRQRRMRLYRRLGLRAAPFLPEAGEFIGYWRLRDWLRLLGLEVEVAHFGCYRPAVRSPAWLDRLAWMDAVGARWWPIFGAAYLVVAVKRVRGMRLREGAWMRVPLHLPTAPVSVAGNALHNRTQPNFDKENPFEPR